ncbi:MAG: DUF58 domain-containing protein [Spartobacteria bacterium]|nr:DUF58 domain-containing protein [Spartobacteria bacterium]
MMYPGNRLLAWTALLLPFAATATLVPSAALVSLGILGVFALLVMVDALAGGKTGSAPTLSLPTVVRMARTRPGVIPVHIHNPSGKGVTVRIGLPLPRSFSNENEELTVRVPAEQLDSRAEWRCTPDDRGRYELRDLYFSHPSPLGFWHIRRKVATRCEMRVYPDLEDEKKRFASLFLHRGAFGVHAHRMIGQGREFEKLRDYVPGDSYEDIHWKATAKRRRPITKLFQIERTQEVYVLIDTARLSGRLIEKEPVLERYISAAMVVGLAAEQQGDLFGMIPFSNRIDRFIRAAGGKAHHRACRDMLYSLGTRLVTPDFQELATGIRLRLRRRALLVILTDLADPVLSAQFLQGMQLLRRQHVILVCMIKPPRIEPLFSTDVAQTVDDVYCQLGGHMMYQSIHDIQKRLRHMGIDFAMVENEKLSTALVTRYMNIKARQIL